MEIAVQTRGRWEVVLETARWAEERGLAAFALPDHYLERGDRSDRPAYDHYVHLAALTRETRRIELVSLVSPVTFRHPAVLYKMGVTLDEISNGRFTLGLGIGWLEEEFRLFGLEYPPVKRRFQLLEEAMAYLRAAIRPGPQPYEGNHYQLGDFDPQPHPKSLRLLVGGGGREKTPRLAGLYADEFNIYGTNPANYAERVAAARSHAAGAGRHPEEILMSTAFPAVAARGESDYRRLLDKLAAVTGSSPERIEKVYAERGYPHGYGGQPREMLEALEEAGCRRVYLQMFLGDPTEGDVILEAFQG